MLTVSVAAVPVKLSAGAPVTRKLKVFSSPLALPTKLLAAAVELNVVPATLVTFTVTVWVAVACPSLAMMSRVN